MSSNKPPSLDDLVLYDTSEQVVGFLKILVYGPPGVGKTKTSLRDNGGNMTAGPILLLSAESGTLSTRDIKGVTVLDLKPNPNDPRDVDPKTGVVLRDGVDKLRIAYRVLASGRHKYATLVVDSLTELQKMFLLRAVKDAGKGRTIPEQRDWGVAQASLMEAVRLFRDLPMNVIMTALEAEAKDEISGEITYKPMLSGKSAAEVPAFLDLVARMKKVTVPGKTEDAPATVKRVWVFDGDPQSSTKDRSGVLPNVTPASFHWVYNKIFSDPTAGDPRTAAL